MIIINDLKFAENEKEFTSTLFEAGGTAYGYAKKFKHCIYLYDMQKNVFAVLVNGVLASAEKQPSGKIWHSYGKPGIFENMTSEDIQELFNKYAIDKTSKGLFNSVYTFK